MTNTLRFTEYSAMLKPTLRITQHTIDMTKTAIEATTVIRRERLMSINSLLKRLKKAVPCFVRCLTAFFSASKTSSYSGLG